MRLNKWVRVVDQSQGFRERGYVVIDGLLSRTRSRCCLAKLMTLQMPEAAGCERPHNRLVPLRWGDPVVELILAPGERRHRIGESVDGNALRWISGYISVKEANSRALWWHQDWWCWDHPAAFVPRPRRWLCCAI